MSNDSVCPTFRKVFVASVLGVFLFLIPNGVQSASSNSAKLQWRANQEADLKGYQVYRGTTPGVYGGPQNAGPATTYQYDNLESNKTHYFSITAYDQSGNESPPSLEVSKAITAPNSLLSISISGGGTVTSSPTGVSCTSGTCTGTFPQGSKVTLTAVPSSGSTFSGWGGACIGTSSCVVTLSTSSASVTAMFIPIPPSNDPPPNAPPNVPIIDQSGWTLVYVDSEELGGSGDAATQAFDGLSTTIWHTEWQRRRPAHDHDLMVDLGAVYSIAGFRELPRQDGGANGRIGKFEFYVKTDSGTAPTTPPVVGEWTKVAMGTFPNTAVEQEVFFATRNSRYVWLRAVDEAQGVGNPWTSLAELNVLGTRSSASAPNVPLIDQSGWTLVYVDSEELGGSFYAATQAFDGLNATIWHTEWRLASPGHPHDLIVDLGAVYAMEGFRALPRQDGGANGRIGQYEFYVKTNSGTAPTTPPVVGEWTQVATGTFPNTAVEQEVLFTASSSRYVWLRAVDEAQGVGKPYTTLAELNVLGTLNP